MRQRKSLSKTSVSAIRWSFVKRFDSTAACLEHLQSHRFTSVVTSPHKKAKRNLVLHEGDYIFPRLAVWFGNESRGISDEAVAHSEFCFSIPMFGMISSLNLGTTSGIVLYEITKQRREYQLKYKRPIVGRRLLPRRPTKRPDAGKYDRASRRRKTSLGFRKSSAASTPGELPSRRTLDPYTGVVRQRRQISASWCKSVY